MAGKNIGAKSEEEKMLTLSSDHDHSSFLSIMSQVKEMSVSNNSEKTIPIHHKRMAFRYAWAFIVNEIVLIETTLLKDHLLEESITLLEKRLSELKNDLSTLESYNLHD